MVERDSEGVREMHKAEELKALIERVRVFVDQHRRQLEQENLGTKELGEYLHQTIVQLGEVVNQIYTQAESQGRRERGINAITLQKTISEFRTLMHRDFSAAISVEELVKFLVALNTAADILETQAGQLMRSGFVKIPPEDLPQA